MPRKPIFRSLKSAVDHDHLWDGDILLFRGKGWLSWLIQRAGGSEYSHAAMVGWRGNTPYCLETREWKGSRAVTLASQVRLYPEQIDVYRLKEFARPSSMSKATDFMWAATGQDYGWDAVMAAGLRHLPLVRLLLTPDTDDDAIDERMPFCSQLLDQALRQLLLDPVNNKAGRITEPGDLARSALLEYRYTLGSVS